MEPKEPATNWQDNIQLARNRNCFGACHDGSDLYRVYATAINFPDRAENKTLTGKDPAESHKWDRSGL